MQTEVLEGLRKAILEYNAGAAASWAKKAAEKKVDPVKTLEVVTETLRAVGEGFGKGELWLPDLIGAADATQAAIPIIDAEIKKTGAKRKSAGKVVLGTVAGDIHDIGKAMVASLLRADGFEVIDLGINVPDTEFAEAVRKHEPDILAMSALLTITSFQMISVIATLTEKGLRDKVKIMVGGGAITQEFANQIGADGYEVSAPKAVPLAKKLVGAK